jgi:hypothetical protein
MVVLPVEFGDVLTIFDEWSRSEGAVIGRPFLDRRYDSIN